MQDRLTATDGRHFIGTSGASLGWGTGAAVSVALASDVPVTLVIGDGGYGSTRMFERFHVHKVGKGATPGHLGSDLRQLGPSVKSIIEGFGIHCMTPSALHGWCSFIDPLPGLRENKRNTI